MLMAFQRVMSIIICIIYFNQKRVSVSQNPSPFTITIHQNQFIVFSVVSNSLRILARSGLRASSLRSGDVLRILSAAS